MNPPFPLLQQPPGSNSCIPTCVRAILSWHGQDFAQDQVSEWCGEAADGCEFSNTLLRLQDEGFDVEEVNDEDVLLEKLTCDEPEPIIAMIRTPDMTPGTDHAVIIFAIQPQDGAGLTVDYMDPIDGSNHSDGTGKLLRWWDLNGSRSFIIRP